MAINYRTDYQRYRQYYVNLRRFYQKPTVKVSFFVLLSFVTVTFFTAMAIRPPITTIGALIRDIEDKRVIDDLLEEKLGTLDELQCLVSSVEDEEALLAAAVPEEAALGRFLQELEYLAQQHQVRLTSLRFGVVTLGQTTTRKLLEATTVPFSLSVTGNFLRVGDFLRALERLDRIVVVEGVRLGSGNGSVGADVVAQIFYIPPGEEE